jgi:tetratricopeptide (TPR) repeat protein
MKRYTAAMLVKIMACLSVALYCFSTNISVLAVNLPSAERRLQQMFKGDSRDLESEWQRISKKLGTLANLELTDRALELSRIAPEFNRLAQAAHDAKKLGFLHYITAVYATYYGNIERALAEINKAVAVEPNSPRYIAMKGQIYVKLGEKSGRDQEIETGIQHIQRALEALQRTPDPLVKAAEYEFNLAFSISTLSKPRWDEVIVHYERYINSGSEESVAFAWNNLSVAYRHIGDCGKALEGADGALGVAEFGAARRNKRAAEFCLEMEKLGMISKTPKTKR